MALPEGNPYRAVAERSYRPRFASDDGQWERALPLFMEILAADPKRDSESRRLLDGRRCTLARHLYWLAGEYPDHLNCDFALDEIQVSRSARVSSGHRTRKSETSYKSQVASFRAGFPKLFPPAFPVSKQSSLGATDERAFSIAMNAAETFRSPRTRDNARALLLLCRGAGLDGLDCRFVAGGDVYRIPGAGLWVRVRSPRAPRDVPVLERFAPELEKLAGRAGSRSMIGDGPVPTAPGQPNEISDRMARKMTAQYPGLRVTPSRLRKAWMAEQIATWDKLQVFLQAAGLKSMHSVEDLQGSSPAAPADPASLARLLGGGAE